MYGLCNVSVKVIPQNLVFNIQGASEVAFEISTFVLIF